MKFGELSDDFYKYCRRWKRNSDEFVNNVLQEISSPPASKPSEPRRLNIHLNFRYFTRIMFNTPTIHVERLSSLV